MQITGPYTPAVGVAIQVNDPAVYTKADVSVQIQNESDFPLLAVIGGGINSVAPFTAETIATNSANLLVINPQAGGTTGEITLVWLLEGEASPVPDGPLTGTTTVVRGGGSVAFYPSLTGPGESATPGALSQAGDFTVTAPPGSTVGVQLFNKGNGSVYVENDASAAAGVDILDLTPFGIHLIASDSTQLAVGPGSILLRIPLASAGGIGIDCQGAGQINIAHGGDKLIFFQRTGQPAVGPQVSGGTLAGVIAGLVALGLFNS